MKILLTGSSGFIGSNFIKFFGQKYEIKNFSLQKEKIENIDFKDITTVLHLAALVHQMNGADEDEYKRLNVDYPVALAKKAKDSGVSHFIFMSSIKAYGEESSNIYKEDTLCAPIDAYGISKLNAEHELKKLEDDNFIVSIIRTPVVYGYGVKANILNLIRLVEKMSILPFGKIKNRRSMVYVGNLCALIDSIITNKKSGIFLASDDKAISTSELIETISKALNKKTYLFRPIFFETILKIIKPNFHSRLYGNLEVDNEKTKKVLGFKNPYSFEDGIRKTVEEMS